VQSGSSSAKKENIAPLRWGKEYVGDNLKEDERCRLSRDQVVRRKDLSSWGWASPHFEFYGISPSQLDLLRLDCSKKNKQGLWPATCKNTNLK